MPFQKGLSGNPNGRPKRGETMADALRAALTPADKAAIAAMLVRTATKAKRVQDRVAAARMIFEYTDGKPLSRVQVGGDAENREPIPFRIVRRAPRP